LPKQLKGGVDFRAINVSVGMAKYLETHLSDQEKPYGDGDPDTFHVWGFCHKPSVRAG
jgi:hypothetical protein